MSDNGRFALEETAFLSVAEAENLLKELASVALPEGNIEMLLAAAPPTQPLDVVEARYQTLVEQIPAVIFMAFLEEGVSKAYVSPQIETMLGFTQTEWLNDPVLWYRQIHPEDRGRWSGEAAELFLVGNPLQSVYRVLARDGSVIWFHCHAKMVRAQDGRPWFIHGVGFDITDLKRAEGALQQARDELEDRVQQRTSELARTNVELAHRAKELAVANADLEQFAYAASHDLQEPIRNVALSSELLREQYQNKLDPEAERLLNFVIDGAQRMSVLVRDLLAYSRIVSVNENVNEPVDANGVLSELLNSLQTLMVENQAVVTFGPLPVVKIPKVHLQQVLQNLILNALKYRREEPPRVHISAERGDGNWVFSIADNGIGIPTEYHEYVFGIFKRLHGREKYAGTGVGLALCKRIVERYGGRIWVEPKAEPGATFLFTLPIG